MLLALQEHDVVALWLPLACLTRPVLCFAAQWGGFSNSNPLIQDDVVVLGLLAAILQMVPSAIKR